MPSDAPAPEALLEHAAFVRAVAYATLRSEDLVDDAVQETWMAALEHGQSRRGSLRAWLGGVARRKAALLRRRQSAQRHRDRRAARSAHATDVLDTAERAEIGRRLVEVVLSLEEPSRSALLLRYYDGLPPREIARRLGVPVETVRTRCKRGIQRLRDELDRRYGDEPRGWRAALLPLIVPLPQGAGVGLGAGGLIVTKKALAILGLLVLLVASVVWVVQGRDQDDSAGKRDLTRIEREVAPEPGKQPHLSVRTPTTPALPQVDRDRDLHGFVVDEQGLPIAGARLTTFGLPWRRTRATFDRTLWRHEVPGPTTHSAADGAFALRLRRATRWNLRVEAEGYASLELASVAAGERLRVVMTKGVSLRVVVSDAAGRAVPGATVRATRPPRLGDVMIRAEARTDAHGACTFPGLPGARSVRLEVEHASRGSSEPVSVTLPKSGEALEEVTLQAGRRIVGRVTDRSTGAPIEGARVGFTWVLSQETRTDRDGRYELRGWTEWLGREIHVRAPGYARGQAPFGEVDEVDVALTPGSSVTGRVLGEDRVPLAGARVSVVGTGQRGATVLLSTAAAAADAGGRFLLEDLQGGLVHTLIVTAPEHGRRLVDFRLAEGSAQPTDVGDIQLARGARITGVVLDADGEPVPRVAVRLEGNNADRSRLGVPTPEWSYGTRSQCFTDDIGRFGFVDLSAGTYSVSAEAAGGPPARQVTLAPGQEEAHVRIGLPKEGQRRVIVTDAFGRSVEGARVILNGRRQTLGVGTTDEHGTARFDVREEPIRAIVTLAGELAAQYLDAPPTMWPKDQVELRVTLQTAGAIGGTALLEDGSPYRRGFIHARRNGKDVGRAWTDAAGRFLVRFPGHSRVELLARGDRELTLPNGTKRIVRSALEGRTGALEAGTRDVVLRMRAVPADGTLVVRVLDPDGNPAQKARVVVTGQLEGQPPHQDCAPDGRTTLKGLPRRPVTLFVSAVAPVGRSWDAAWVRDIRPEDQEIVVRLRENLVVQGRVLLPDGTPARGAFVRVDNEKIQGKVATDAKGSFFLILPADAVPARLLAEHTARDGQRSKGEATSVDAGALPLTIRLVAVPSDK